MDFEELIVKRPTKEVYKDKGRTIKLFVENYSKANILNEAVNQARVEETSLHVPSLLEVTKIENRWALISEYVEGTTLEDLMIKNPEKEEEYLLLFVDTQIKVLSERAPLLGRIKDKMKRKITSTDMIDNSIKYELLQRLEGMPTEYCVCHGDFHPSNIIIKEEGEIYIIDWAHVTQGSPVFDAARTYLLFSLEGKEPLAEKYVNLFVEKSGTKKKDILRCVPIVACTQKMKGVPEEQEFLERWIDVVDYM